MAHTVPKRDVAGTRSRQNASILWLIMTRKEGGTITAFTSTMTHPTPSTRQHHRGSTTTRVLAHRHPLVVGVLSLAALAASACTNEVIVTAADGVGGTSSDGGGAAQGGAGGTTVVASDGILIAEYPDLGSSTNGSAVASGSSSGGPPQTEPLHLIVGNYGLVCADPFGGMDCGSMWAVSMDLQPNLLQPGVVYPLSILNGFASLTGPIEPGGPCYGGGGTFENGSLEIVAVNSVSIDVVLSNTDTVDFDANGPHHILRCAP